MRRLLFVIVGLLLAFAPVRAAEPLSLDGLPFDLFQRSLKTSSGAERGIIRAHLAKTHARTGEGLFSAAWIAGTEGREEDAQRLYRAAIDEDPELTVAYINLALSLERSGKETEALETYDKALNTAPFDLDLVRNGYFLRRKLNGDKMDAMRFLEEWQEKVGNLDFDFDFVRALDAETDGDYVEAERLYESAIAKDAPFEVYERLANLRLNRLSDDKMAVATRIGYVTRGMEPLLTDDGSADAHLYVGRMLRDRLNAGRYSISYFTKAFDIWPTAETAGDVFTQMAIYDFEAARAFLENAVTLLPDNYEAKNDLAWMHYQFLAEPEQAGKLALEALELAPHDAARMDSIRVFGLSRQVYGRFDEAYEFYVEKLKQNWPPKMRSRLLRAAAENSIAAQKFDDAKKYLDVLDISGNADPAWLKSQITLVDRAIRLEAERKAAPGSAPLEPATQNILFGFGSDVIPARSREVLDALADAHKAQGGDAPVLSIEGYTDSTGAFELNEGLSYRRAKAVRDYLVEKQGVDADKLRIDGHGTRHPAASNKRREGRMQNRRVEIWPLNADAQTLRPGAMKGNTFSPDHRHAVFGQSPPQIWDTRTDTGRAALYRARSSQFSPDGKLVAAISSYTEESGETTEAIYIYDAASGHAVVQIHEPHEVVEQTWRPDSGAVAFATADGFLKIYDLATQQLRVARMGTTRIGGPLVWLPNGRTIAGGQHRGQEIVLWDAETLQPVRRFGGVNWPHTMGASPDGRFLLAFDNRMTMSVWDLRRNGEARQVKVPMIPLDLQFHPDRPWVVLNAKFEGSDISLAVMDYVRMKEVSQWASGGTYAIGLSADGKTVTAIAGERELSLDTATLQPSETGEPQ